MEGGRGERERDKSVDGKEVYGRGQEGRKGKKKEKRRSTRVKTKRNRRREQRKREKARARGSNLPFSSLKRRVY